MKASWTPGPWRVRSLEEDLFGADIFGSDETLVTPTGEGGGMEWFGADVKLIALAPEMAEAILAFCPAEGMHATDPNGRAFDALARKLRAIGASDMSADDRKSMLPKKATCRCGHPDCPHPAPEVAQPCGHPVSAVVSSDEGTAYCAMCEAEQPTCGIAGCVGKHYPQDHNAIFDTSTDDQSRSLFHSLQDAIRERDALQAELERVKAERNTIHDWYVDAKTENVRLRALIRKDTNDE